MSQALEKTEHNALLYRDLPNQHPISAIEGLKEALDSKASKEALDGKVPTERKVNGQTLDNDVEITEVKSAEKFKTARTINGVEFDGTYNIKIYGESELPKQRFPHYSAGWVRFAELSAMSFSAIIQISREYAHGSPEVYTIGVNYIYGNCNFVQLSAFSTAWSQYITKIRAVYYQKTVYLEYYYDSTEGNHVTTKLSNILTSHPDDPFSNIEDVEGSIPEGYSVTEFDLSKSPLKVSSLDIGNTTITETQLQALLALLT